MKPNRERQMLESMARAGLRVTERRKSLAKLFAEAAGYLTPKEVYDRLETKHRGLSFETVYRNLRILQDLGMLEQFYLEDGVKFRIGRFAGQHHHHHLICLSCERVYPLDFCPMDHVGEVPNQFKVVKHRFEIYGYCAECTVSEREEKAPAHK
ncbi:transcriptional repressor [Paenibacillus sp. P26]|nr:transcriptional repressor [Paenibacillus sp. P26]